MSFINIISTKQLIKIKNNTVLKQNPYKYTYFQGVA